jgi:hypothetical protein
MLIGGVQLASDGSASNVRLPSLIGSGAMHPLVITRSGIPRMLPKDDIRRMHRNRKSCAACNRFRNTLAIQTSASGHPLNKFTYK